MINYMMKKDTTIMVAEKDQRRKRQNSPRLNHIQMMLVLAYVSLCTQYSSLSIGAFGFVINPIRSHDVIRYPFTSSTSSSTITITDSNTPISFGLKYKSGKSRAMKWSVLKMYTEPIDSLNSNGDEEDDEDEEYEMPPKSMFDDEGTFSREELERLTVTQLKQQLRLRDLKVGGKKKELIDRLLGGNGYGYSTTEDEPIIPEIVDSTQTANKSKAREFAESRGKELIDVTAYLEEEDKGKESKSSRNDKDNNVDEDDINKSESPEAWGDEARIVEDYEGRSVVVDNLSRTVVEFKGSGKENVQAYVVASRESLKMYLAGGDRANNTTDLQTAVRNIQLAKEKANKVPVRMEDVQGEDVDDEEGHYKNVLDRDFGDWGQFSMTGVQLSAQEVKGVLLLSDVYGPFGQDTQMLAEKIAFECQPVVVFAPDLFRGKPWVEDKENQGFNKEGNSYEEWRGSHPDDRVSVDIRAAAAALREQYGVSSVSIFGQCYGGGRALEAAARLYPNDTADDVTGDIGPPHVDPSTCIAWYPTRYDADALFGKKKRSIYNANNVETAVMAIFAGEDNLPGATPSDAAILKACLEDDDKVKDYMVKVFPGQRHGFAHIGMSEEREVEEDDFFAEEFGGATPISMDSGDAEVACLLSTAWMETYARAFLPTTGGAVRDDEAWAELNMPDLSETYKRDIRGEIEEALNNHQDADFDLKRMHPDDFKTPIDDLESMDADLIDALKTQPYGLDLEDDPDTFLNKLEAALDREDIDYLPGFGEVPLDESELGQAYW